MGGWVVAVEDDLSPLPPARRLIDAFGKAFILQFQESGWNRY
jgi:hypothetical protein